MSMPNLERMADLAIQVQDACNPIIGLNLMMLHQSRDHRIAGNAVKSAVIATVTTKLRRTHDVPKCT